MPNNDFPRILTLLRKERGFSQKKAAADLGISQALLSHYEKGVRECGLDFLVRAAAYYGVSCDYLLGAHPPPGHSPCRQPTYPGSGPTGPKRWIRRPNPVPKAGKLPFYCIRDFGKNQV